VDWVEDKPASRGVSGARVKIGLELWPDLGTLSADRRVVNDRVRLLSLGKKRVKSRGLVREKPI